MNNALHLDFLLLINEQTVAQRVPVSGGKKWVDPGFIIYQTPNVHVYKYLDLYWMFPTPHVYISTITLFISITTL